MLAGGIAGMILAVGVSASLEGSGEHQAVRIALGVLFVASLVLVVMALATALLRLGRRTFDDAA